MTQIEGSDAGETPVSALIAGSFPIFAAMRAR